MMRMAKNQGVEPQILDAVDQVNQRQKLVLLTAIEEYFKKKLNGKRIAIWGLAFKPRTDDIREAPSLVLIDALLERGAQLSVHDPVAMDNVQDIYGDRLTYASGPLDALDGSHALVIMTEWGEFRHPDLAEMRARISTPVIFDGRNLYDTIQMEQAGFTYYSIGRPPITLK